MPLLIGRETLLQTIRKSAAAGCVALWGAPGVGKTSLALALEPEVVTVDLRGKTSEEAILVSLLQGLGASAQGDLDDKLGMVLRRTGVTLIADNLGTPLPVARVRSWLSGSERGDLRPQVIATTTQQSVVEGWPLIEVPPLEIPSAVALLERWAPGSDRALLEAISVEADALPLALMLLAPRIRTLGASVVHTALAARSGGASGGLGAIDRILDEIWGDLGDTRQVLAALSAAAVPFDFPAASALVESLGSEVDAVEPISSLVDNALLRQEGTLFSVSNIVRTYAIRRTDPAVIARAEAAWLAYVQKTVRAAYTDYERRGDTPSVKALLGAERMIRRALDLATSPEERIELLLALEPAVVRRGPYPPSIAALRQALDPIAQTSRDPALCARGWRLLGEQLVYTQRFDEAKDALTTAARWASESGKPELVAKVSLARAWMELHRQRLPEATARLSEAATACAAIGERVTRERMFVHHCCIDALLHKQLGQPSRAAELNHRAARLAHAVGNQGMEMMALRNSGDDYAALGDTERARSLLEEALALAHALEDRRGELVSTGSLGLVHIERGDYTSAGSALKLALERAASLGDRWYEGLVVNYLGMLALFEDDPSRACDLLDRSAALQLRNDNPIVLAFTLGLRSAAHALLGRLDLAEADLASANQLASTSAFSPLSAVLDALAPILVSARIRQLASEGDTIAAKRLQERMNATLAAPVPSAALSCDVRAALRLRDLLIRRLMTPSTPTPAAPRAVEATIALDGSWFAIGEARCELASRAALRRILACLGRCALDSPGLPIDISELFSEGWPGERAAHTAARNRVYNAIYTLRKLGLDELLQRRDEGWCLDPARPIRIVDTR